MQFQFQIRRDPLCVVAVEGHGDRERGLVACAFVVCVSIDGTDHWSWGYGSARNTETFYLYGLDAALEDLFAHDKRDTPSMQVFVFADGFMSNVLKHTPYWMSNGGKKKNGTPPDAYPEHKRIFELSSLSQLQVTRVTPKSAFPQHTEAEELAGQLARKAASLGTSKQVGLARSGRGKPEL